MSSTHGGQSSTHLGSIAILYGSQAGFTASFAKRLHGLLARALGADVSVHAMDRFAFDALPACETVVLLTSTWESDAGLMPQNAVRFWAWLRAQPLAGLGSLLARARFAVCGFGSQKYRYYCGFAVQLHEAFLRLGAAPLVDLARIDVDTPDRGRGGPHPRALVLHNDGRYAFSDRDHDHAAHVAAGVDGRSVLGELAGCPLPFPPDSPLRLRVRYEDRALTVDYSTDEQEQGQEQQQQQERKWTRCCVVPRITLPVGYHFGFSAANDQQYENQDLLDVIVRDLRDTAWSLPVSSTESSSGATTAATTQQQTETTAVSDVALLERKLEELQRAVDALGAAVAAHARAEPELATPELVRRVGDARFQLEQAANGLARQQSMLEVVAQNADGTAALLAGADADLAAAERLQSTARAVLREQEGAARTRTRATYGSLIAVLLASLALAAFQYWRLQHVEKSHSVRF